MILNWLKRLFAKKKPLRVQISKDMTFYNEFIVRAPAPNPNEGGEVMMFQMSVIPIHPPTDQELEKMFKVELSESLGQTVTDEDLDKWRAEYSERLNRKYFMPKG